MKPIFASAGPPKKLIFVDVPAKGQSKRAKAPIDVNLNVGMPESKKKTKFAWMSWAVEEDKCGNCEASDTICQIPKGAEKKLKDWIAKRLDAIDKNEKIPPRPQNTACGPCKHNHLPPCIFPFFSELMHPRNTYPAPIVNQINFTSFASGIG